MTVYSDNQVGYNGDSIHLKYFKTSAEYNLFTYYKDGIHEVDRDKYITFYQGLNIPMMFNKKDGKIYMLKNSGTYCFLYRKCDNNKLYFLNGGQLRLMESQDTQYYFDNLKTYSDAVNDLMSQYNRSLDELSKKIKTIGGNGNTHGCIVDIDFYNHIYLNPWDRTITPYYATDIVNKKVYKNISSLLFCERKDLYDRYVGQINSGECVNSQAAIESTEKIIKKTETDLSTEIYGISRIFKGLQYSTNYNIVRTWYDKLNELNDSDVIQLIKTNMLQMCNK
jgi:hypothetical protein